MSGKNRIAEAVRFFALAHHIHIVIHAHRFKIRVFPETGFDGFNELPGFDGGEPVVELEQNVSEMILLDTADKRFVGAEHPFSKRLFQ